MIRAASHDVACIGAGSSSEAYRSEQLLQLCTQAAQEEDIPTGQGRFQQALALAQKYNSPTWELHFQYLHSLMLQWQHASSVVVPLVKDLFPDLMQQPYKTVQRSMVQTWPELQGQRQLHVAFALKLLEKCFQWVQTGNSPGAEPVLKELEGSMKRLALLQVDSQFVQMDVLTLQLLPTCSVSSSCIADFGVGCSSMCSD